MAARRPRALRSWRGRSALMAKRHPWAGAGRVLEASDRPARAGRVRPRLPAPEGRTLQTRGVGFPRPQHEPERGSPSAAPAAARRPNCGPAVWVTARRCWGPRARCAARRRPEGPNKQETKTGASAAGGTAAGRGGHRRGNARDAPHGATGPAGPQARAPEGERGAVRPGARSVPALSSAGPCGAVGGSCEAPGPARPALEAPAPPEHGDLPTPGDERPGAVSASTKRIAGSGAEAGAGNRAPRGSVVEAGTGWSAARGVRPVTTADAQGSQARSGVAATRILAGGRVSPGGPGKGRPQTSSHVRSQGCRGIFANPEPDLVCRRSVYPADPGDAPSAPVDYSNDRSLCPSSAQFLLYLMRKFPRASALGL